MVLLSAERLVPVESEKAFGCQNPLPNKQKALALRLLGASLQLSVHDEERYDVVQLPCLSWFDGVGGQAKKDKYKDKYKYYLYRPRRGCCGYVAAKKWKNRNIARSKSDRIPSGNEENDRRRLLHEYEGATALLQTTISSRSCPLLSAHLRRPATFLPISPSKGVRFMSYLTSSQNKPSTPSIRCNYKLTRVTGTCGDFRKRKKEKKDEG